MKQGNSEIGKEGLTDGLDQYVYLCRKHKNLTLIMVEHGKNLDSVHFLSCNQFYPHQRIVLFQETKI